LGKELFIGIMFQLNGPCGTLCVTETISFTEDRIHDSLFALSRLTKLYGTIGTGCDAGPTPHTLTLVDITNRARGDDRIM
jgi:hypothetical protein